MNILILGASGGCGKWIVKLAQGKIHQVKAIVRDETSVNFSTDTNLIRGSVMDKDILKRGLHGCDAVFSALGIKRKNPWNPWSPIDSPLDLTTQVAEMLVDLMPEFGLKRFIGISAAGVRESRSDVSPILKWMISRSNIGLSYNDLARMELIFENSNLDWMAVRPVTLIDGPPTGKIVETNYYGLFNRIKRADVATWILNKLEQSEPFSRHTPMITSG